MTAEEEREATSGGGGGAEGGNGDAVAQAKERGWDASNVTARALRDQLLSRAAGLVFNKRCYQV